ncbi:ABC transporter permease [Nonlabens ponticola]|uniref:FtsX-like permease family protein n=1 Tax=Nonlabens ponticola TaxID=2496866 RepID=A0A3S9MVL5_9FLAO|nr:FtsX-like permease family protein [Nonlabens ponticola]AZQ43167.1 FtsX-like permease family protein [Nonlabens ponticola]
MNISYYIARRYLVSKNGKNAINIINILSFIITIVGTAALFIVLSGFSGLKDFSTSFSGYFDPDLQVTAVQGKTVQLTNDRLESLLQTDGVDVVAGVIEEKAFLNYDEKNDIAFIKGVPNNYTQIISTDSILIGGSWLTDSDPQIVIGAGIATDLSVFVNDYSSFLQIMVPKPGEEALNVMNLSRSFRKLDAVAVGMFSVNEELDNKYIFITLDAARALMGYNENTVSAVEIKLSEPQKEDEVRQAIASIFEEDIIIKNKLQLNGALYKMLNSENLAVYLIFTLVLIIALFNVVGSIIMMILDKKKNLKTLLDLGAQVGDLRKVFFIQGTLMTLAGGLIGLLIGVAFVVLQIEFDLVYIAPGLPYPFAMDWTNVIVALSTIAVLGMIASYTGSRRINDRLLSQAKL